MTTNEQWIDEILARAMVTARLEEWNDKRTLNEAKQAILQKLQEEYKRGYIDGGISQLTKQEEQQ